MDYALAKKILLDCFRLDRIDYEHSPVLTVAHDTDRSLLRNGKYYSPLIDTLEDDLAHKGIRCLSIARVISTIKGELSYGRVRSPEGRFARALVTKRLTALFARGTYPYSRMEEATWGKILDATGATRVVGIQPSRELCVACHERGAWVADVQHGAIADTHLWYGEKFRAQDPREQLPDAFLCWDQGSAQVIEKWAQRRGVATRVIGNRWLARFMNPAPGDAMAQEFLEQFAAAAGPACGRRNILVSLSWGESESINGFIAAGLERVIKQTSQQYRWLIRLHPNQLKGFATHESARFWRYFDQQLAGHAEWEIATRYPLPVILRNIDLHISWTSSVCIEAAQMGVKSALLSPALRTAGPSGDYYEYYRSAGMVEFIEESAERIESWIGRNLAQRSAPESYAQFDTEYAAVLALLANDRCAPHR